MNMKKQSKKNSQRANVLHNVDLSLFVDRFRGKKILVYGDEMLDLYIRGDVERISPEAPVPVIIERSREYVLGGAGNVAANIASLG